MLTSIKLFRNLASSWRLSPHIMWPKRYMRRSALLLKVSWSRQQEVFHASITEFLLNPDLPQLEQLKFVCKHDKDGIDTKVLHKIWNLGSNFSAGACSFCHDKINHNMASKRVQVYAQQKQQSTRQFSGTKTAVILSNRKQSRFHFALAMIHRNRKNDQRKHDINILFYN